MGEKSMFLLNVFFIIIEINTILFCFHIQMNKSQKELISNN